MIPSSHLGLATRVRKTRKVSCFKSRTAGLAGNIFTGAVKASIAPLVTYARGSTEATAQLVALAEQAGYNGPASMKALTAWLGNTTGATKTLKNAADQATIQEALLTGSMKGQGQLIAGQLLGQLNAAELKYSGVAGAVSAYGRAIATQGAASSAAQHARTALIDDIVKMGQQTHSTTGQIAAMISKLLGIPTKMAIDMVLNAEGNIHIAESIAVAKSYYATKGNHFLASGGLIPSGFPNDSFMGRLTSGEAVVPPHLTPAVAPFLAAHGVPGFAAGYVPSRMSSYTGSWSGGDTHVHVMVAGDTDPDAAARRIVKIMRAHKTKHGIVTTGIG